MVRENKEYDMCFERKKIGDVLYIYKTYHFPKIFLKNLLRRGSN